MSEFNFAVAFVIQSLVLVVFFSVGFGVLFYGAFNRKWGWQGHDDDVSGLRSGSRGGS